MIALGSAWLDRFYIAGAVLHPPSHTLCQAKTCTRDKSGVLIDVVGG